MWFGSGIKKDNQGFLNIVKSIIEEWKKNQENKFYNKKRAIDQIKQQDFDMLKNEDILEDENHMGNSFGESDKNDQNLWFFINNFEWNSYLSMRLGLSRMINLQKYRPLGPYCNY